MDATELDRALQSTMTILAKVEPGQLDAPTPCASWDVRALINHFTGTARWWAGVIAGEDSASDGGAGDDSAGHDSAGDGGAGDDASVDYAAVDYAGGDYVAAYAAAAKAAVAAFSADDVPGRMIRLPFGEFPGAVVTAMAALDQYTHGWDLARAIGYPAELDPGLAADLLGHARLAISEGLRGPDGAAPFGPAVDAPAGAGPADQLAAFLGRPV